MIQWYPGHMAKAMREMGELVKLVDAVVILIDARIPASSINPKLDELFKNKTCVYIFTKKDKADDYYTKKWLNRYKKEGKYAISIDLKSANPFNEFYPLLREALKPKREKDLKKGLKIRPAKLMIVGIPNVGKSTFINRLVGKKVVAVGDKPGVTKQQQWIRINENSKQVIDKYELLDTPGVLWPKFENEITGYHLALTGAISDNVVNLEHLAMYLCSFLKKNYEGRLTKRYDISEDVEEHEVLEKLALKKRISVLETAKIIINDYRNDAFQKITLDVINDD